MNDPLSGASYITILVKLNFYLYPTSIIRLHGGTHLACPTRAQPLSNIVVGKHYKQRQLSLNSSAQVKT